MNREIKFRVFDNEERGIIYLDSFLFEDGLIKWKWDSSLGDFCKYSNKFQQFTGLKDHNSKGIYEGDLIDLSFSKGHERDDSYDYYGIYTVEFKDGEWSLIPSNNNDSNRVMSLWLESSDYVKKQGMERFEIIGNIFENPELS